MRVWANPYGKHPRSPASCLLGVVFLVLSCVCSGGAQASVLATFQPVSLQPGERLEHVVQWQPPAGVRVQIRLGMAPVNARMEVNDAGQLTLIWQSDLQLPPETLIQLVVDNVDTGELLESRNLLIRRNDDQEPDSLAALPEPKSITRPILESEPDLHAAPRFGPFQTQTLQVGVPWQLLLLDEQLQTQDIQVFASNLPENAAMVHTIGEGHSLSWTPDRSQEGEHQVELRALSSKHPQLITEVKLQLRVEGPEPVDPDTPYMRPMANQVVSPGRVLTFRVSATIADGSKPTLTVDRLPRHASFDINADDSRTFYWLTSEADQGEHLFRFSAIHPNDPDLRTTQEVLMVIGDPSRSKTIPAELTPTETPLAISE